MLLRDSCLSVYRKLTCLKRKQGSKNMHLMRRKNLISLFFYILERDILQHVWEGWKEVMVKSIIQHGSKGKSFANFLLFFW